MTRDEQLVVILLGAILMSQRAAAAIDAAHAKARDGARTPRTVGARYGKEAAPTHRIDLLA